MQTINLSYPLSENDLKAYSLPQVFAIGQFDGLHLGHVSVVKRAISLAKEQRLPASLMTFYPHPKEVMKKGDYDGYLTPPHIKEDILKSMGVERLYIVEFNEDFSRVSPKDFVEKMLLPLQAKLAVIGFDFRFGYKGQGDADMLRELGNGYLQVHTVEPFLLEDQKVSSSGIRKCLNEGLIEQVTAWLGRPYMLRGTVVNGEKRGRTIGFPTANVELSEHFVLPVKGVYAVRAEIGDSFYSGVMNIGVKPTFHDKGMKTTIEVHLLDFSGDIYNQEMTIYLVDYLRSEQKFASVEELIAQISRDAENARVKLR